MENLALFNQFPRTKTEQKEMVAMMVERAKSGEEDILRIEAGMANIEAIAKEYRANKEVKEMLIDEVLKYPKGIAEAHNATFQLKEVGVKYDFSNCGHQQYNAVCAEIARLTEIKKEMEGIMKAHGDKSWVMTDADTGETYEVCPPSRTASQQVCVTIKK